MSLDELFLSFAETALFEESPWRRRIVIMSRILVSAVA
jgi:hypothetical protein